MKTLHLISTVIIFSLTSSTFANGDDDIKNEKDNTSLTLTVVHIDNPSCNGGADGKITVEAIGGKAPYTYNWNTFPAQSTETATDLSSGTYFVQVTDANGDIFFRSVYIENPNSSVMEEFEPGTTGPVDITATVTGENAPYSYSLNGEMTETKSFESLPIGIHKLVITDANQCEMVQYIQVFEIESEIDDNPGKGYRINSNKEELKPRNSTEILVKVSSH